MCAHLHRVAPVGGHQRKMRSSNGGWHGLAGCGFRGLPETGAGLWADDGTDFVSVARSPLAVKNLCLAELRSVSEFSGAKGLSLVLAGKAGRPASLGDRRALQADQARRTARRRRRVPAALIGWVGKGALRAVPTAFPKMVGSLPPSLFELRRTSRSAHPRKRDLC